MIVSHSLGIIFIFFFFLWWRHCDLLSCVHVNGTPAFIIVSLYLRNPIMLYIMCVSASFRAFVSAAALYDYKQCTHTRCALPYQCVMQRLPAFLFGNVRHLAHVQTSTCRSYFDIRRVSWRPLQFSFLHLGCFALAPPEFSHCCVPRFIIRVALFRTVVGYVASVQINNCSRTFMHLSRAWRRGHLLLW